MIRISILGMDRLWVVPTKSGLRVPRASPTLRAQWVEPTEIMLRDCLAKGQRQTPATPKSSPCASHSKFLKPKQIKLELSFQHTRIVTLKVNDLHQLLPYTFFRVFSEARHSSNKMSFCSGTSNMWIGRQKIKNTGSAGNLNMVANSQHNNPSHVLTPEERVKEWKHRRAFNNVLSRMSLSDWQPPSSQGSQIHQTTLPSQEIFHTKWIHTTLNMLSTK